MMVLCAFLMPKLAVICSNEFVLSYMCVKFEKVFKYTNIPSTNSLNTFLIITCYFSEAVNCLGKAIEIYTDMVMLLGLFFYF